MTVLIIRSVIPEIRLILSLLSLSKSTTEFDAISAWAFNFQHTDSWVYEFKSDTYYVRVVRAF